MTLSDTFLPKSPPLHEDEHGVIRISGSRITLDTVLDFHKQGLTAEQIVEIFDSLAPADIYAVIAYYLNNRPEVDAYLDEQSRRAEEIRERIEAGQNTLDQLKQSIENRRTAGGAEDWSGQVRYLRRRGES